MYTTKFDGISRVLKAAVCRPHSNLGFLFLQCLLCCLFSHLSVTSEYLVLQLSDSAESSTDIVTIGDKGRAQLQRLAPDQIRLSIADTYKDRVTFSQVRFVITRDPATGTTTNSNGSVGSVIGFCLFN